MECLYFNQFEDDIKANFESSGLDPDLNLLILYIKLNIAVTISSRNMLISSENNLSKSLLTLYTRGNTCSNRSIHIKTNCKLQAASRTSGTRGNHFFTLMIVALLVILIHSASSYTALNIIFLLLAFLRPGLMNLNQAHLIFLVIHCVVNRISKSGGGVGLYLHGYLKIKTR